ncbi:hypothetical protein NLU13_6727 [Sarocladium strictum]|uniref:Mitochondrial pyruvate carrier n=1 Tax=Sarocladium strictum TaxID=5046 RepID=A0AA39L636_SARSR|nr:hypothetical protein NLU13_6727 [Sarocladium strictum]
MAAFIKAANAKIRSNPWSDYLCSTHFWGPVSNFGIPIAAVMDSFKSPDLISGKMTGALCIYAITFARYSVAVTPPNYLLLACHVINGGAQFTQMFRFVNYNYMGGREKLAVQAEKAKDVVQDKAKDAVQAVKEKTS